jgi:hypothetical protein
MEQEWKQFQRHFKVVQLTDNGNLERVIDWYFEKKPPFGEGKKAKEFPDAIMVSALDKYCAKHKTDKLAVISRDGGFKDASASRPQFVYFESLSAYLEKSIAEQTTIQRIHKLLEERAGEFRSGIEQHFERLEFTVEQESKCCVGEIQIIDVEIRKQSIIELEGTRFTVAVEGFIVFRANVRYAVYSDYYGQFLNFDESRSVRNQIEFSAAVGIKSDAEFNELEDYSITHFLPESVFVDSAQGIADRI